ncbi:MAG TPA: ABC transporter ATP-binding protein [Solirubrobacterales bacterium]|jgi:simple sugar transport system ATP-binding protein
MPSASGSPLSGAEAAPATAGGTVAPQIRMRGISVSFGDVRATQDVDFDIRAGEIHALLGENGAGKTTLMRVLSGLLSPDSGEIELDGEPITFDSPRDAIHRGIGMVHQHSVLVKQLTVAENIILGERSSWTLRLPRREVERPAREICERYGVDLDVRRPIGSLSADQVQQVEILRLLHRNVGTLILDEPTAVLGTAYVERLFSTLADLRQRGHAIVVITHKLKEVFRLADRATVLRGGRVTAEVTRAELDQQALMTAMVGESVAPVVRQREVEPDASTPVVFAAEELCVDGDRSSNAVDSLSFEVRAGEVLGVAGVEGNGQTELVEALGGVRPIAAGTIRVGDQALAQLTPSRLDALGVGIISEDRRRWDLVPELSAAENLILSRLGNGEDDFVKLGFLRRKRIDAMATEAMRRFDVRPPVAERAMTTFSGGNQQKVVLARELAPRPPVVVAAYPSRGLDVAATRFVHQELLELRDAGSGVLLISADLDELLALSDRVGVLYRGHFAYMAEATRVEISGITRAMTGIGGDDSPAPEQPR